MFHLFNPFPFLLDFSIIAPLILRLVVGYFFLTFAFNKLKTKSVDGVADFPAWWKMMGALEFILGLCFIIGLGVQIDSIVSILILLGSIIWHEKMNSSQNRSPEFYWLLLFVLLSLLLSGAGPFAIDLPL